MTRWGGIRVDRIEAETPDKVYVGEPVIFDARIFLNGLGPKDVQVEIYTGSVGFDGDFPTRATFPLVHEADLGDGMHLFKGEIQPAQAGRYGYTPAHSAPPRASGGSPFPGAHPLGRAGVPWNDLSASRTAHSAPGGGLSPPGFGAGSSSGPGDVRVGVCLGLPVFHPCSKLSRPWARTGRTSPGIVPDGDTLVLRSGEAVRLLGIDAPETAHLDSEARYYSDRARDLLRKLTGKRTLRIVPGPARRDRYGRILALVYLPDGTLVNRELLRRGMAFYYPFPKEEFDLGPEFLRVQRQAMDPPRRGLEGGSVHARGRKALCRQSRQPEIFPGRFETGRKRFARTCGAIREP